MGPSIECVVVECMEKGASSWREISFLVLSFASTQAARHTTLWQGLMRATAATVVKAVDVAPGAYNGANSAHKDKPDDLLYDLHHLAAVDSHPVRCL